MKPDNKIENNQQQITFPEKNDILTRMHLNCCFENAITYAKVLEIAEIIEEHNGKALLVGGCVRDMMLNKISKDFDLEVYGISIEELKELLMNQNIKTNEVGRSYGILKAFVENGSDIDISLPRQDSKIDKGHKGFEVKTDPNMSIQEAARRRDFTINSITADPLTQEVFDYYNGVDDVEKRVLKIIDPTKFIEDPLRVLRGIQFIGRFGLTVDKQTMQVMQEIIPLLKELPKERIYKE
jgi:tRNA nucleotidyltransferase (CCA-adding enzyme)